VPAQHYLGDQLLWPGHYLRRRRAGGNPLLRGFTAVVHGFAYLPRGGLHPRGFPTDTRGFPTADDLVADEAARAVRTLARAAAGLP
jgi:hypothetical protein